MIDEAFEKTVNIIYFLFLYNLLALVLIGC